MTISTTTASILDVKNEFSGGSSTIATLANAYTTAGNYTMNVGSLTSVRITCVGGGGGGGGSINSGDSHSGAPGGPGGVFSQVIAVTPGETLYITVGAFGNKANTAIGGCVGNGGNNGSNGGDSTVRRTSFVGPIIAHGHGGFGGFGAVGDNNPPSDGNHPGGSGISGIPADYGSYYNNPLNPWPTRNSYYLKHGGYNNTGFGAGGDGVALLPTGVICATAGTGGMVSISWQAPTAASGGGSGPSDMASYYAGGAWVPNPGPTSASQTSPIPVSGPIALGSFLGVSSFVTINDVVDMGVAYALRSTGYDVGARAVALGWDGVSPFRMNITINTGVHLVKLQPSGVTGPTFSCLASNIPASAIINLYNYGVICGSGGTGGDGGSVTGSGGGGSAPAGGNGQPGSAGMQITRPISIWNEGYDYYGGIIAGGGGGGGGGVGFYQAVTDIPTTYGVGGGGGGGGQGGTSTPGTGSNAGQVSTDFGGYAGERGQPGTTYRAGDAGFGGGVTVDLFTGDAGYGGRGGGWGQQGGASGGVAPVAAGGAPGVAFTGGAFITWKSFGTVVGEVDNWGTYDIAGGAGPANFSALQSSYRRLTRESGVNTSAWANMPLPAVANAPATGLLSESWYWNSYGASGGAAAGSFTISRLYTLTTGTTLSVHLYGAIDNSITSIVVNGVSVATSSPMAYNSPAQSVNFTLQRGTNCIQVTVNNSAAGPAGFNIRLRRTSDNVILAPTIGWFMI